MKKIVHIEGMSCSHCAALVNIELYRIKEVSNAKVDIRDKTAIVTLSIDIDDAIIINAVQKAGYTAIDIAPLNFNQY
jgi:copper chaperone